MNVQVLFESQYGNTERVADAIAEGFGEGVQAERIDDAQPDPAAALLVIGGPTQGHGASPAMKAFLGQLPQLPGVPVATFDTRLTWPRVLSGAASDRIARALKQHGARVVAPPESFLVTGREGPLVEGEMERARAWAEGLRSALR